MQSSDSLGTWGHWKIQNSGCFWGSEAMSPQHPLPTAQGPLPVPPLSWALGFPAPGILFSWSLTLLDISFVPSTELTLSSKLIKLRLIHHVIIPADGFVLSNYHTAHLANITQNNLVFLI